MRFHLLVVLLLPSTTAFDLAFRGSCRFFLDTADVAEYRSLLPLGMFHGVTCNPTILQRCGVPNTVDAISNLAKSAFDLGAEEFMCQAWGGSADNLYTTGLLLRAIDPERVVVKLPITSSGVEAAARLMREPEGGTRGSRTRICFTACYGNAQALIAGAAGAEYLAPYLGRMTDAGKDGMDECDKMDKICKGLGSGTRILVASIRDVDSMATLAARGLDTFTFSPAIARALFLEPLTDAAAVDFEEAAQANDCDPHCSIDDWRATTVGPAAIVE